MTTSQYRKDRLAAKDITVTDIGPNTEFDPASIAPAAATNDTDTPADNERVIQTSCEHCGQDVEGFSPFPKGEWRDRGNNTDCPDDSGRVHAVSEKEIARHLDDDDDTDTGAAATDKSNPYPYLCPNCGKENARWGNAKQLVVCSDCNQEIDLDDAPAAGAHTATPLRIFHGSIVDKNGNVILDLPDRNNQDMPAFIVRAVNAHAALVSALEAILKDLQDNEDQVPPIPAICELWAQGAAALALAKSDSEGEPR